MKLPPLYICRNLTTYSGLKLCVDEPKEVVWVSETVQGALKCALDEVCIGDYHYISDVLGKVKCDVYKLTDVDSILDPVKAEANSPMSRAVADRKWLSVGKLSDNKFAMLNAAVALPVSLYDNFRILRIEVNPS